MIHFAQEEEKDERKLKLCLGTLTVVEPQSMPLMYLDSRGRDSAPSRVSPSLRVCSFLWRAMILFSKVFAHQQLRIR